MSHGKDVTLTDLNRREIDFPENQVKEVLPEFFRTEYPKLITLLDKYYEFEDSDQSPSRLVNELFYNRDITQVDADLLSYIEDELLLGQSYFEGFTDKRAAAKYSSTLYRSKGTKYSIEQFFRTFFGVDPEVVYTKEQIFNIGDSGSQIGFDAQRFLTDDKLYQKFAIQIKSPLDFNTWREPYKLFTHPAGMFIGSEVLLTSAVEDALTTPVVTIADPPPIVVSSNTTFGDTAISDITGLVDDLGVDSSGILSRINLDITLSDFTLAEIQEVNNQYGDIREAQISSSPTLDDTSIDFSNNFAFETFDQERHVFYSSDSDQYLLNLGHLS